MIRDRFSLIGDGRDEGIDISDDLLRERWFIIKQCFADIRMVSAFECSLRGFIAPFAYSGSSPSCWRRRYPTMLFVRRRLRRLRILLLQGACLSASLRACPCCLQGEDKGNR